MYLIFFWRSPHPPFSLTCPLLFSTQYTRICLCCTSPADTHTHTHSDWNRSPALRARTPIVPPPIGTAAPYNNSRPYVCLFISWPRVCVWCAAIMKGKVSMTECIYVYTYLISKLERSLERGSCIFLEKKNEVYRFLPGTLLPKKKKKTARPGNYLHTQTHSLMLWWVLRALERVCLV